MLLYDAAMLNDAIMTSLEKNVEGAITLSQLGVLWVLWIFKRY